MIRQRNPIPRESEKHKARRLAEGFTPRAPIARTRPTIKPGLKVRPTPRKRPKATNPARKKREFARTYHSRARVRFVKALPCVYCQLLNPFLGLVSAGKSDNAHTEGGGLSRKGPYTSIVPLDRTHHRMYDDRVGDFANPIIRDAIAAAAPDVERAWLAHLEATGG